MSRSYGLLVLAFGLILSAATPTPDNISGKIQHQTVAAIQDSLDRTANAEAKQAENGEYQAPCADGEYKNKSDLCAQWYAARAARDAADSAYWAVFWTIVSIGVSGVGLVALLITIKQGREANAISRDASRAWISFSASGSGKFWLSSKALEFTFDLLLENHGDSPAIKTFAKAFLVLGDPRKFVLPALDKILKKDTDAECIVFPNSSPMETKIVTEFKGQIPEQSELNLVVVCRYRIVGHDDWRSSTQTFNLRPKVEMYTFSGRFRDGVCTLGIPENHAETIDLFLKERSDCPPTAT